MLAALSLCPRPRSFTGRSSAVYLLCCQVKLGLLRFLEWIHSEKDEMRMNLVLTFISCLIFLEGVSCYLGIDIKFFQVMVYSQLYELWKFY